MLVVLANSSPMMRASRRRSPDKLSPARCDIRLSCNTLLTPNNIGGTDVATSPEVEVGHDTANRQTVGDARGLSWRSLPGHTCRMANTRSMTVYSDYKSPYAYLAKDLAYELERACPVRLEWRPYILDIPSYLGSARVDANGTVLEQDRNAHQWRRVRYSYMDCRRAARKRGLVIRGTQKIWDSSLAAAGMLYAQRAGDAVFRRYHDTVFERFWKRELDIEDIAVITAALTEAGADAGGFPAWADEGRAEVASISRAAEAQGVFGVPTFVLDGELFWGREHLPELREMLAR